MGKSLSLVLGECDPRVRMPQLIFIPLSLFLSPDETEWWNVYHATEVSTGACDGNRYTMAQKVNWNADGTPNFGEAVPLGETLEGPSGE